MIIHAEVGNGFLGTLQYVYKEGEELVEGKKPVIIVQNNISGTTKQQALLMRCVAMENTHSNKPVLHYSVTFNENDNLTNKRIKYLLEQSIIMHGGSIADSQYAIVKHLDAESKIPHYHIVLNKVDLNGKNIDTNFYKNKAHAIADRMEKEYNLVPTIGRTVFYDITEKYGYRFATKAEKAIINSLKPKEIKPVSDKRKGKGKNVGNGIAEKKQFMQDKLVSALDNKGCISKIDLEKQLSESGIDVRYTTHKETGELHGVSFSAKGHSCSGSDIGINLKHVEEKIAWNLDQYQDIEFRLSPQTQIENLENQLSALELNGLNINTQIKTYTAQKLDINESIKLGEMPIKPLSKVENEIKNQEHLQVINQKEIDNVVATIEHLNAKILEKELENKKAAAPATQVQQERTGNDELDRLKYCQSYYLQEIKSAEEYLSDKRKYEIGTDFNPEYSKNKANETIQFRTEQLKDVTFQIKRIEADDLPLSERHQYWNETLENELKQQRQYKREYEISTVGTERSVYYGVKLKTLESSIAETKEKLNEVLAMLPPQIISNPVGKQAEMENQIIILERRLIEIKERSKELEQQTRIDFNAINPFMAMKIKANIDLLNARDELAEYKDKVEHLQEQNEDLTILQIDKILKDQEEKGEQRGNSNSMGM